MKIKITKTPTNTVGALASNILALVSFAQIEHWKTKSYAKHVALGDFYEEMPDLIDAVVEEQQGMHGLVEVIPTTISGDFISNLKSTYSLCSSVQEQGTDCTNVINKIDEIKSLISKTIYKLENLS